ncbi:MAG: NAD(P)H-dependent oxidoreductase [Elusimicrobia bacterium]|nr:NAD(P)H-dependent oxidoreductase [Elusimicrobiota bacterium]
MVKVLIVFFSRSGNTAKMAELVKQGVESAGAEAVMKEAEEATADDMLNAGGIIMGSPTYYGLPAAEIKQLLDESVRHHGKLEGKAGGAFSSAANIGGGNETTIMAILQAMLIHGMVIPGTSKGDHYGPVSIGAPDGRVEKQCVALGKRVAELAIKLS